MRATAKEAAIEYLRRSVRVRQVVAKFLNAIICMPILNILIYDIVIIIIRSFVQQWRLKHAEKKG